MKNPSKSSFGFLLLVAIVFALGSPRLTTSARPQNSTPASQTKTVAPAPPPESTQDPSGVIFFPKSLVAKTAAGGGLLYNGNPQHNYRIHVLRRDKPGEVEIHSKDTDIIYIIGGSATFATGGTTVGAKDTAPDEVRGPSMTGGVARQVSEGDVLVVPANVPHWFKEIQQPILYFVAKVR